MQGKLSEIDIRSILQLIELGQRTGELFVEAYPSQSAAVDSEMAQTMGNQHAASSEQFWFVFFLNGQIIYAADPDARLLRLRDYLQRYGAEKALNPLMSGAIATANAPEYSYLWALMENHILTPAQGRSIIQSMVRETLFDLLSLHHGTFIFEIGQPLSPQLTTFEIAPLLTHTMKQVQRWKQFYPYLYSTEQCPIITNVGVLQEALSNRTFNKLSKFADGKTTLRQIGRYLNRDILTVAQAIYPYIQQGVIQLTSPEITVQNNRKANELSRQANHPSHSKIRPPKIVCIDDGVTVRETVKQILIQQGYEVIAIGNPLEALSRVFQIIPDLILCDITMPELDGYEVCAMLRTSTLFRQTPIIMLTGKDGFIDRVRAKLIGATDYLTKPFGESELLMLVESYIGSAYAERQQSSTQLTGTPKDEVQLERTNVISSSTPLNS
ncbi:MAG: response regulator [Leptolyngbya sp.]|nr:MAG: response regulator [Leptolyngbya sp.]